MRRKPFSAAVPAIAIAVLASASLVGLACGQAVFQAVPVEIASGVLWNPSTEPALVWSQPISVPGAASLRLVFAVAELGGDDDRIVVRNLADGEVQVLDRAALKRWRQSSGFFRGGSVVLEVDLAPGSTAVVSVDEVVAQFPGPGQDTLCGGDDRSASADARVCRLISTSPAVTDWCTGFLVSATSTIVTAGHCHDAPSLLGIAEFNVPASSAAGTITPSAIADQYPVDVGSIESLNLGIGDDWAVARLHPNSSGATAVSRQGSWFTLASFVPIGVTGYTVRVTGCGADTTPLSANGTQQTATGPLTGSIGELRHQVDTEPHNSGSPIIRESTGEVIGIHTNGGCTTSPTSYTSGTSITVLGLLPAVTRVTGCAGVAIGDSTATLTCTSTVFSLTPTPGLWNVVAVSSAADWDVQIGGVSSAASSSACDFLVANGHNGGLPPVAGTFSNGLTTGPVTTLGYGEHETAAGIPAGESICTTFLAGQVADLYEFTLPAPGMFEIRVSGSPTLRWSLFAPGTSTAWRPRSSAVASGAVNAPGGAPVALGAGVHALVISRNGGPSASALTASIRIIPMGTFFFDALSSGSGAGDLCLSVGGIPPGTDNVIVLVSTLPANAMGPVLGLELTPLLLDILAMPPAPGNILHFPAGGDPYSAGPFFFPPGTFSILGGLVWEARAVAYSLTGVFTAVSPIRAIGW